MMTLFNICGMNTKSKEDIIKEINEELSKKRQKECMSEKEPVKQITTDFTVGEHTFKNITFQID